MLLIIFLYLNLIQSNLNVHRIEILENNHMMFMLCFFIEFNYQVTESVLKMAPADGKRIVLVDDEEKVIYILMGDVTFELSLAQSS